MGLPSMSATAASVEEDMVPANDVAAESNSAAAATQCFNATSKLFISMVRFAVTLLLYLKSISSDRTAAEATSLTRYPLPDVAVIGSAILRRKARERDNFPARARLSAYARGENGSSDVHSYIVRYRRL